MRLALAAWIVAAIFCALFVRTYGTLGGTSNGGAYVDVSGHTVGLEVWGVPGVWTCDASNPDAVTGDC